MQTQTSPDFRVEWDGSIALVEPLNNDARAHLTWNVGGESHWYGPRHAPKLVVEHRFVPSLVEALIAEGYTVDA